MPPTHALVTSRKTNNILKYNLATGAYAGVFASGLFEPTGMVIGPDGKVFVINNGKSIRSVVRYNTDGTNQQTFASDPLMAPLMTDLAFDANGKLYIANPGGSNVLRCDTDGSNVVIFASGEGLISPNAVRIGNDGKLYVSDDSALNIARWNIDGTFDQVFVYGVISYGFVQDSNGDWYIGTTTLKSVFQYDSSGTVRGLFATAGGLEAPGGLAFGPEGSLYACNTGGGIGAYGLWSFGSSVLKYSGTSGAIEGEIFSGGFLNDPRAIVFV